jgi:hypothetical protein
MGAVDSIRTYEKEYDGAHGIAVHSSNPICSLASYSDSMQCAGCVLAGDDVSVWSGGRRAGVSTACAAFVLMLHHPSCRHCQEVATRGPAVGGDQQAACGRRWCGAHELERRDDQHGRDGALLHHSGAQGTTRAQLFVLSLSRCVCVVCVRWMGGGGESVSALPNSCACLRCG